MVQLSMAVVSDQVFEMARDSTLEITIFLVAIFTHVFFFGKHSFSLGKGPLQLKAKLSTECGKTASESPQNDDCKPRNPSAQCHLRDPSGMNTIHRNAVIKAIRQDNLKEARDGIEAIRKMGTQASVSIFNELLDATIKTAGQDYWSVVDLMQKCGVRPNCVTCSILLKSITCVTASIQPQQSTNESGLARIFELLNDMDADFDEVLLNGVVEACVRIGRADLLAPQLQKKRFSNVELKNAYTYANIIRAYSLVGEVAAVWRTWRDMRKHTAPTKLTLAYMVEALCTNGEVDASYELLHDMLADDQCKSLVNTVAYGSVLKGFSHQKRFDRVLSMYHEMLEHKFQFSLVTFNTLLDACARSGDMTLIPVVLKSMMEQGIESNIITYSIIVKAYCQENRLDEALQVWKDMVQTTTIQPDEVMYNTILAGCARKGAYVRGMALFAEMEKAKIQPSNVTLSVLVKLANRHHLLDKAFALCEDISRRYMFRLNVHVFNNLIQACIANNKPQRAFDVLQQMMHERVRPDLRSYSLLLPSCILQGQTQDAAGLIRLAFGLQGASAPSLGVTCGERSVTSFMQLKGGLPSALLVETLDGIGGRCRNATCALELIEELNGLKLVKLPANVTARLQCKVGEQ